MFSVTKQAMRAAIEETPDGRVFYPHGRAGYLIDSGTEARVARFLTGFFFAQIAVVMVFVELGAETNHRLASMLVCVLVLVAIRALGLCLVLRGCPRVAARMQRRDAVRRAAETYGTERIWAMVVVVLLLVPTPLLAPRDVPTWERATMIACLLAMAIYVCVYAGRVLRAKAAMRHPPGAIEGA